MTAQPITGLEMMLSQHDMCQTITGLGSDVIPACSAVKHSIEKSLQMLKITGGERV